ncbi:hypothetical protein KSP40_PGU001742 [Platanthera guangdongensis]|uniref:Uncharacterized protein n=1 Tax=Platanthera guangdongensis TaxID=2320717 RepID=A0ABR2MW11_9ASPA
MDPATKKLIVSRDIVFDELTPYCGSSYVELEISRSDGELKEAVAKEVELPESPGAPGCSSSGAKASESGRRGSDAPGPSGSKVVASGSGSKGSDVPGRSCSRGESSSSGSRGSVAPNAFGSSKEASCSGSKGSIVPGLTGNGAGSQAAEVVSHDQVLRRSKRISKPPARYCEGNTVDLVPCFLVSPQVEQGTSGCDDPTRIKEVVDTKSEEVTSLRGNEAWASGSKEVGDTPVMHEWRLKLKKAEGSMAPFGRCWRAPSWSMICGARTMSWTSLHRCYRKDQVQGYGSCWSYSPLLTSRGSVEFCEVTWVNGRLGKPIRADYADWVGGLLGRQGCCRRFALWQPGRFVRADYADSSGGLAGQCMLSRRFTPMK